MKEQLVLKPLLMVLVLFLYPILSFADSRPDTYRHVITKAVNDYFSIFESGPPDYTYDSNHSTTTHYFYQADNPELIDYVNIEDILFTSTSSESHTTTIDYTSEISFENGYKHIHYHVPQPPDYDQTLDIYKDSLDRIVDYNYNWPNQRVRYYYNPSDNLDSIKTSLDGNQHTYRMHYDTQGFLDQITYSTDGIVSPPINSILITYPNDLPLNMVGLHFDKVFEYYIDEPMLKWMMVLNPVYQIDSFFMTDFSDSIIHPLYNLEGQSLNIQFQNIRSYDMLFDSMGYLTHYNDSQSWIDGNSYHSSQNSLVLTWADYVSNDDPIAPNPLFSLHVSPNPFRNEVKLEMPDKANSPADIAIYNIRGQLVKKWEHMRESTLTWDGRDSNNMKVSNGVYLIKATANGKSHTGKIVKF
ncbi:MAG TPA: T9SS type A sorting domain-containing protein [Candidatus Cloacimonadota bacterium]|nr:T9SS type A sorting domain-containing protein [Candidatus Cloacimonadota bacterium]